MPSAASIIKKVNAVLTKVGPPTRLVYLRTTDRANADSLTGYAGTTTVTDTLLSPQPYYTRLGRDRITGAHTKSEDAANGAGTISLLDDWIFYISPDAISPEVLSSPDFLLVLKLPPQVSHFGAAPFGGNSESFQTPIQEEVFKLMDVDSAMIYGGSVLNSCYMRSVKRT